MQPTGHTQRLASRLADALARGRMLEPGPAFDAFLAGPVDEIYAILDAFERHVAGGTQRTDDLADAYLRLLEMRLEHLRYDVDANHDWAKEAARAFQLTVVEHVRDGRLDGTGLAAVGRALHEAKLAPIPALIEVGGAQLDELSDDEMRDLPGAAERIASTIVHESGDDPFALCEAMAEGSFTLPPEAKAAGSVMLLARPEAVAREAAVLVILDPIPEVRRAIALALHTYAAQLSPISLRRLITLRNWLPEAEHHLVDQVVRAARAGGVDCAPHAPAQAATIQATGLDGAGAQGFLIVSPEGKKWRLSSILTKRGKGILEAWCGEPQSKGALRRSVGSAGSDDLARPTAREYLDLAVRHHLALGRDAGALPPVGLVQVAEILGGPGWQPEEFDWQRTLDKLIADVPEAERTAPAVSRTLASSALWSDVGTSESWFEKGQDVDDLLSRTRVTSIDRAAEYFLRTLVVRRAARWAEQFVWVALWLRHARPAEDARWRNFALLARAVADGSGVAEIPIMRQIALRSIATFTLTPSNEAAPRP